MYITPGNVKAVNDNPNAPTKSKTTAMSSINIPPTIQSIDYCGGKVITIYTDESI